MEERKIEQLKKELTSVEIDIRKAERRNKPNIVKGLNTKKRNILRKLSKLGVTINE